MSYVESPSTRHRLKYKHKFTGNGSKRNLQIQGKNTLSPQEAKKHKIFHSNPHEYIVSQNFTSTRTDKNVPKYNRYLTEKTHTTADSEAGAQCTIAQLLRTEIEKKMQEEVKNGIVGNKGREYQKLKQQFADLKFEEVSAIEKWAHDDYYIEEIWDETLRQRPLFHTTRELQPRLSEGLELASEKSFSSLLFSTPRERDSGCSEKNTTKDTPREQMDKWSKKSTTHDTVEPHCDGSISVQFDHTKEAIRIPIYTPSRIISGGEIAQFLQNNLRLPYSTLNNTLCPTQLSFTTCVDFLSVSEQSALLVFDGDLHSPDVAVIIKRLNDLINRRGKIGILGPNKSIIFGDPVIVPIALDNINDNGRCNVESDIDESLQFSQGTQIVTQHSNDMLIDLNCLPNYRHTCILRNIPSNTPIHRIIESLDRIQAHGFINYTSLSRHGHHLTHAFGLGKLLMHRRYHEFLVRFLDGLASEDCSNLGEIVETIVVNGANPTNRDWKGALIQCEEEVSRIQKGADKFQMCGFNPTHSLLFQQILKSGAESRSFIGEKREQGVDPARIIREAIHRNVIIDILQAVSDVHWNAFSSLRLKMYGLKASTW